MRLRYVLKTLFLKILHFFAFLLLKEKLIRKRACCTPPPLFLYDRKLFPRLCCWLFFGFMKCNKFDIKATKRHYLYLLIYGTHVYSGCIIVNINISVLQNMKKHRKHSRIEVCSCAKIYSVFLLSTNDSLATLILTCCTLLTYYFCFMPLFPGFSVF